MLDFWLKLITLAGIPFLMLTAIILWRHANRRATLFSYPFYSLVSILCIGVLLWTLLPVWIPYNWSFPVAVAVMFVLMLRARHQYALTFKWKRKSKRKNHEIEEYDEA